MSRNPIERVKMQERRSSSTSTNDSDYSVGSDLTLRKSQFAQKSQVSVLDSLSRILCVRHSDLYTILYRANNILKLYRGPTQAELSTLKINQSSLKIYYHYYLGIRISPHLFVR